MLKKHKSFDLDKERVLNQPKHEQLYEPKKCKNAKYIVIPLLIGFMLLCILVNVDFTGEAYLKLTTKHECDNGSEETTSTLVPDTEMELSNESNDKNHETKEDTMIIKTQIPSEISSESDVESQGKNMKLKQSPDVTDPKNDTFIMETDRSEVIIRDSIRGSVSEQQEAIKLNNFLQTEIHPTNLKTRAAAAATCTKNTTNCYVLCKDGNANYIEDFLGSVYGCTTTGLTLIIQNCEFTSGTLSAGFLGGLMNLKYLAITESNLKIIQTATFKHSYVKNLKTLILKNNLLTSLTATTFDGLSVLNYFEFIQQPLANKLTAEQFLKPMALSLSEATISLMTEINQVVNPKLWLQGSELRNLTTLDMSNNNFQDILDSNTFRSLLVIENLILANCSLVSIAENTFDIILETLEYIDLRQNQLQILDMKFLQDVLTRNIRIELNENEWYCDCENKEMIKFFETNINLAETIVCYAPVEWKQVELKQFVRECMATTTTEASTTTELVTTTELYTTTTTEASTTTELVTTTESSTTITTTTTEASTTTELVNSTDISTTTTKSSPTTEFSSTTEEITEVSKTPTTTAQLPSSTITTENPEVPTPTTTTTTLSSSTITTENPEVEQPTTPTTTLSSSTSLTTDITEDSSSSIPTTDKTTDNISEILPTTPKISTTTNTTDITETSTLPPPNLIPVICHDSKRTDSKYFLEKHDFFIYTTSSSSVTIIIPEFIEKFDILYFTNRNDYMNLTQNLYTNSKNQVHIIALKSHLTYVFCLVTNSYEEVSPFDCQAHFVYIISKTWLLTRDQSWFLPVIILMTLMIAATTMFLVYIMLRKHPIWLLNRNDRILKVNNSDNKIIILSKQSSTNVIEPERSSNYIRAQPLLQHDIDKYSIYTSNHSVPGNQAPNLPRVELNRKSSCPSYTSAQNYALSSEYLSVHFNRFKAVDNDKTPLYTSNHRVPVARAPELPKHNKHVRELPLVCSSARSCSKPSDNLRFNRFQSIDEDPDYQTIDHYEVIH